MKHRKNIIPVILTILLCLAGCEKKEDETVLTLSQIPAVYLNIDPEEFQKINDSENHEYYSYSGTISITVPENYHTEYSNDVLQGTDILELEYIRGRGNGTWGADKKPFAIKLKDKADLLGMGENKHWVLLANRYDETLLRNRLVSYISQQLGMEFTPGCINVDLFVNDEFYGNYSLAERVRIGESRVAIDELKSEDISEPEITGGYLLRMHPSDDEASENIISTQLLSFACADPEFTEGEKGNEQQYSYISAFLQDTEDAIYGDDFKNEKGISVEEYIDLRSLADYWWIQEFTVNYDAFKTDSTYLYKKREGKLCFGPVWDFDLTFDGGVANTDRFSNSSMPWQEYLRAYHPEYQQILLEEWQKFDQILEEIIKDGGILDRFSEEISASRAADHDRWSLIDEEGNTFDYDPEEKTADMKNWIIERRAWINGHLDELFDVYYRLNFYVGDELLTFEDVLRHRPLIDYPEAPSIEGKTFVGWKDMDGQLYEEYSLFDKDTDLYASYE
ncbi:MAG: CotH kinase family protein [Erysipelotrichaceae bacterium]|nr:CotH kinase family protein [Erysipelotrichaceae bacterium]